MLGFLFWFGIEDDVVFVGAWQTLNCSIFLANFFEQRVGSFGWERERLIESGGFLGKISAGAKMLRGCVRGVKLKWPLVFAFSVFSRLSTRHRCA